MLIYALVLAAMPRLVPTEKRRGSGMEHRILDTPPPWRNADFNSRSLDPHD